VNRRTASYQILLLPVSMMLADGQGCLQLAAHGPLADLFCPTGSAKPSVCPPIVETLVAEPHATIQQSQKGQTASVENRARTAFELSMPQGHTLMIDLLGQADWSEDAQGRIGFYLAVQRQIDGEWRTIGSDGVSGTRTGQTSARGRAVVPVLLKQAGTHRLRAVVWSVADPSHDAHVSSCPPAEARDTVQIIIVVLAGQKPSVQPTGQPSLPRDDGWLQPDPPCLDEMLP